MDYRPFNKHQLPPPTEKKGHFNILIKFRSATGRSKVEVSKNRMASKFMHLDTM